MNIEVKVFRQNGENIESVSDHVSVEEPLEIRLELSPPVSIAVTMRTPGRDAELAAGFLYSEGILTHPSDIVEIKTCGHFSDKPQNKNTVRIFPKSDLVFDPKLFNRNFYTTSSCGVCGKASLEALSRLPFEKLNQDNIKISKNTITSIPDKLRKGQESFRLSGGSHASALFDLNGNLLEVEEDIGRHNALDKLIGSEFLKGNLPLSNKVLLVSGRASFELMQKTSVAGLPIFLSIGAPSSLCIELADKLGITLIGFIKKNYFNIYTHPKRVEGVL